MWSVYLLQTRTGIIGPRVHPSSASWDITINDTETLDLTFSKENLPSFEDYNWYEPWWSGALLMWEAIPVVAGPLISRPTETYTELKMAYSGIRALFAKRSCVQDMDDWKDLDDPDKVRDWAYIVPQNTSYATIARNVVNNSITRKLGGDLPIKFMAPPTAEIDPTHDAAGVFIEEHNRPHYRRYAGYEGLNNNVDAILGDLSELDIGPDIMFRPAIVNDAGGFRIQWEMWTGLSDNHPEIPQTNPVVWDTTSQGGYVPDLNITYSGKDVTNRAFAISQNGSGGGSIIAMSQKDTKLAQGFPLLESMETFGGSDNIARIKAKAATNLEANDQPRHQIEGTVRADGSIPVGSFWPGDYGILTTSNWYGMRNDETKAKILRMSGDLSNDVKLSFKEMET